MGIRPPANVHFAMVRLGKDVGVPPLDKLAQTEALVEPMTRDLLVHHVGQTQPPMERQQQRNIVQPFNLYCLGIGGDLQATRDTTLFVSWLSR